MNNPKSPQIYYETFTFKPFLNRVTLVKMESSDGTFMNFDWDYVTQNYSNMVTWTNIAPIDFSYSQEYELNLLTMTLRSSIHTKATGEYTNVVGCCKWL